jgi:hypothetical protein
MPDDRTKSRIPARLSGLLGSLALLSLLLIALQSNTNQSARAELVLPLTGVETASPSASTDPLSMRWVSGGPYGSSVMALIVSPAYPGDGTVFAGTWGSGVFRLDDANGQWEPRNHGLDTPRIKALAISPAFSTDQTLFATTCDGIYASINAGITWTLSSAGLPVSAGVYALAVSPAYASDHTLYAGVSDSGVYRSQDGAETWVPITAGIGMSTVVEFEVAPSFNATGTVYARRDDLRVFRAGDGVNWAPCDPLPEGLDAWSMALSPDGNTLFVGTEDGLFSSDDQCTPWAAVPGRDAIRMKIDDVVVSPAYDVDQTLWVCNQYSGVYRSSDAGTTWIQVITGTGKDFYCGGLAVSPEFSSDGVIFARNVHGDGGVYRSSDAGDLWHRRGSGMTWSVRSLTVSPEYASDGTLFAGLNGGGVFSSTNRGASWQPANRGYPAGSDAFGLAVSPNYASDGTLLAGGYGTGVYRSVDRGRTWTASGLTEVYGVIELAIAPQVSPTSTLVLAGSDAGGVYRSSNGGMDWEHLTQTLPVTTVSDIEFSPAYTSDETVFVAFDGEGLYRSQDQGSVWNRLTAGLEGDHTRAVAVAPDFAFSRTVLASSDQGLFRSLDGGDSWTKLSFPDSYGVADIAFSPHYHHDQIVWVATAYLYDGVFVSQDGGDNWQQVNEGLGELDLRALVTADNGGTSYDVFVGTHTRSAFQRYSDVDILVSARGGTVDGQWPQMQVLVNNETVADWVVDRPEYTLWLTQANLTGQDRIDIVYPNDNPSRTLYVDYAQIQSTTIEATDSSQVVFDVLDCSNAAIEAIDGLLVTNGEHELYTSGALRFSVGINPLPVQPPDGLPIRKVMSDTMINDDVQPSWAHQWDVSIAGNGAGDAVVVWRDNRIGWNDIYAQRMAPIGTLGVNFKVNDNAGWADLRHPDVFVHEDGSFVVIWTYGYPVLEGGHQITGQRYDSDGVAIGGNFTVTQDYPCYVYPSVAGPGDGSFVVAWSDNNTGKVWGQRFDVAGGAVDGVFQIDDAAGEDSWRRHAEVAVAADGSFLVIWQDPRNGDLDIYGQWYTAAGIPIDVNFRINDDASTAPQMTPDLAVDGSGIYVVTWRDRRDGNEDIYAQRYAADRSPIGGNFRINDDISVARQHTPRVATSASGEFVISWWDRRSIEPDAYAQYFDRNGNPVGANFKIDDSPGHQEYGPVVAMHGAQDVSFAWYGQEADYLDIYVNRWGPSATCTVNSTADSGTGTLRECLSQSGPGGYIDFDPVLFSPTAPETITVTSRLPYVITDGLAIDASNAGVILDGSQLTGSEDGLVVDGADYVTIRGLQITGFPDDGIELFNGATQAIVGGSRAFGDGPLGRGNLVSGNGDIGILISGTGTMNNTVMGNLVGTDLSGASPLSNTYGIKVGYGAASNTVGGQIPSEANIASGNEQCGILLHANATDNRIMGNLVGTDISGTSAVGNGWNGVCIWNASTGNQIGGDQPGEGNLISGNYDNGISISDSDVTSNSVIGNFVGTDISGMAALPNGSNGIAIFEGASDNIVGGSTPAERNLISGNAGDGVAIFRAGTSGNQILGNYIGTDVTGQISMSNACGVGIFDGASDNIVGGVDAGQANLISGNRWDGIWIYNAGTKDNHVAGNFIGTDSGGVDPLPNAQHGVCISDGAQRMTIGPGNTIAYNQRGVRIVGADTLSNTITANSIFSNTGRGVSLASGGNGGIVSPTIETARSMDASGTGPPNAIIELFSDAGDEGRFYEDTVTTTGTGEWALSGSFRGPYLTATATDPAGNTSEFSEPVPVTSGITSTWTVMVYLNGDNDLDPSTDDLFNNLEAAADKPNVRILVLWDRYPGGSWDAGTCRYEVQFDENLGLLYPYAEGVNRWCFGEWNLGDKQIFVDFVSWAKQNYPADYYFLSVFDHGGGWAPELPQTLPPHERTWMMGGAGLSWDDTDEDYLSTYDLGWAFDSMGHIDVLFYDACLMSMLENAYEVRDAVDFLIVSQNLQYATVPYSHYLSVITETSTPVELAQAVAELYLDSLPSGFSGTGTVLSLADTEEVVTAVDGLAQALIPLLPDPSAREDIATAYLATQKVDYDSDLTLEPEREGFVDLYHFAEQVLAVVNDPQVSSAAEGVLVAMDGDFVVFEGHKSGYPYSQPFADLHGVALYLPLGEELYMGKECLTKTLDICSPQPDPACIMMRQYYTTTAPAQTSQLKFAQDTQWDEFVNGFIDAYYNCTGATRTTVSPAGVLPPQRLITIREDPNERPVTLPPSYHTYLPIILRGD